jgi:AcrR family transcriptional regulator
MSSSTKEDLLHEASRMLLSKGLNGFSLQELASKLNLKKASLFHHYPSKNALAVELYRYYQTAFLSWTQKNANGLLFDTGPWRCGLAGRPEPLPALAPRADRAPPILSCRSGFTPRSIGA